MAIKPIGSSPIFFTESIPPSPPQPMLEAGSTRTCWMPALRFRSMVILVTRRVLQRCCYRAIREKFTFSRRYPPHGPAAPSVDSVPEAEPKLLWNGVMASWSVSRSRMRPTEMLFCDTRITHSTLHYLRVRAWKFRLQDLLNKNVLEMRQSDADFYCEAFVIPRSR